LNAFQLTLGVIPDEAGNEAKHLEGLPCQTAPRLLGAPLLASTSYRLGVAHACSWCVSTAAATAADDAAGSGPAGAAPIRSGGQVLPVSTEPAKPAPASITSRSYPPSSKNTSLPPHVSSARALISVRISP